MADDMNGAGPAPAKIRKTRGRPASRPEPGLEELLAQAAKATRRGDVASGVGHFDVPAVIQSRFPGMAMQWFVVRVLGQNISGDEMVTISEGGWQAVPARYAKEMLPDEYQGSTVDLRGQRLYFRRQDLQKQAQRELTRRADEARENKLKAAAQGDTGGNIVPRSETRFEASFDRATSDGMREAT